jgi:hypothetical protein
LQSGQTESRKYTGKGIQHYPSTNFPSFNPGFSAYDQIASLNPDYAYFAPSEWIHPFAQYN